MIHVNVALSSLLDTLDATEETRAMVDTGATLSLFPASLLERLGMHRIGQRRFRGSGGSLVRDVGEARLGYDGDIVPILVVFGEEGEPAILGVTALETLGVQVDPVAGQLHRVDMLI